MTRLAILADIHGNLPALEAVIDDMAQFKPDHVIVAGDLINGVPFSSEVMARVVAEGWTAIRGNHEFYMLNWQTERERPAHRRTPMPAWINEEAGVWFHHIAAMPDDLRLFYRDGPTVRVTHGIPGNNSEAVDPTTPEETVREWLAGVEETLFIAGHFHVGFERHVDGWHILNPGPVGMAADGIRKASYVLLEAASDRWEATFRRVDYDFERVERAFHDTGKLERTDVINGFLMFEQLKHARPYINTFLAWQATHHPNTPHTRELIEAFLNLPDLWECFLPSYQVNRELMDDAGRGAGK